jgi:DNA-binding transcriptional LysR family regulator
MPDMAANLQLRWDGYKDLLAFARAGSIDAAAQVLAVDATTLARRLKRFEAEIGTKLILHDAHRLGLTAEGRALVQRAESMEREVLAAARGIAAAEPLVEGVVRVTALQVVFNAFVFPRVPELRVRHPFRSHGRKPILRFASRAPWDPILWRAS